ncbi:helix-turn-helix domain-containing protein [Actinomadura madurae]|uniref:helix-turn-helix domain-containing protein n=1 Tax=Actinomadura madurae TaxID=1993 RepID=UPI0027E36207|nr:helix-turn-helix transcriptional regulator [Actinomadura madurae]
MHTIGDLLRQWRHRRGLSQLDLAIAADVSARHVSLVETGKTNPSAAMVLRLADQLDVPLRERNRLLLAARLRAPLHRASARRRRALGGRRRGRKRAPRARAVPGAGLRPPLEHPDDQPRRGRVPRRGRP